MTTNHERKPGATGTPDTKNSAVAEETHQHRRMTVAENVILTIKVLAGFGFLGAALWGVNLLTSAR